MLFDHQNFDSYMSDVFLFFFAVGKYQESFMFKLNFTPIVYTPTTSLNLLS